MLCIFTFSKKKSFCMIYKPFELWGHWKYPCHYTNLCHHKPHKHAHTHTHTHTLPFSHTHTHTHTQSFKRSVMFFFNVIYFSDANQNFNLPLLQSSVSHNPSEIILICWFIINAALFSFLFIKESWTKCHRFQKTLKQQNCFKHW